jgi:hypothetical protein
MWPCIVTNFLIIKPTRCTNFSNLFWNETLHVSDRFSVHHQELLYTQQWYMSYRQLSSSRIRMELQFHPDPAVGRKLSTDLYDNGFVRHITLLNVQSITPDDGQRNCPKHVEFHSKINLRN